MEVMRERNRRNLKFDSQPFLVDRPEPEFVKIHSLSKSEGFDYLSLDSVVSLDRVFLMAFAPSLVAFEIPSPTSFPIR